jgi:hemolysin activation/secretion protein/AraC-like DNA-binding protein
MTELTNPLRMPDPVHLSLFEKTVPEGVEWKLTTTDWIVLQLSEGIAYAFDLKVSQELPGGGVIVVPPKMEITMTASVLGPALFRGMAIRVSSLTGFLTALERQCLETEVARQMAPFLALSAEHPSAKRVAQVFGQRQAPTLSHRLALAQTFAELVGPQLSDALNKGRDQEKRQQDTKKRLRQILSALPESELSTLSLGKMAKMLRCCERHAARMFREEWGAGFVSYVADLRLKKACHLLLQGNLKIIDVAFESGHGSRVHFNAVFKKRFRMTPTEWRERQTAPPARTPRSRLLQIAAVLVGLLVNALGISQSLGAEGAVNPGANNTAAAAGTNAPASRPPLHFQVDRYEVRGNTVLSSNVIDRVLKPFTGPAVDISIVTNAMAALQLEYYQRGYVTVKVTVPPQQVTNRLIFFQATEGRLAAVKILHNRHFSSNNIMSSLPYVKTLESGNRIMNAKVFQAELDRANSNPDRQISPEVRAGLEPGTSALFLDVKDRLPLHGRLELNNESPPGTPELRVNANASYDNLWQLDHSAGLQYGFSPERLKPSLGDDTHVSLNPLDAPEVTYYSGFYRAPLGPPEAVEDQIAADQTHFGYNETTKQFVLPPSIGRPEFSAYASRSTTAPTMSGPIYPVVSGGNGGSNTLLTINKQLISQQYTSQTTAGGRLSFPLPKWQEIQSTWSVGMDYKEDKVVTLPTNYFYYTTIVTHGNTLGAPPTITHSTIPIPGVATFPALNYTPLFLGWNGFRQDRWGQIGPAGDLWNRLDGSFSVVGGTGGTLSREKAFPILIANSPDATTGFVALRSQVSRTQVLPENFTLYGNMAGQWANEPLLNLEQFALGGYSTVRGYREGEYYADRGWLGQLELRSPIYWRGVNRRIGTQFTVFNDYGQGFEADPGPGEIGHEALWGVGAGVNFNLGPHVESHILVGWPLLNSAFTKAGHERITFSVSAQL